ncbi:hypothetical protein GJAV_G00044950 [Gymnothorax javanicus]|nr:hypothetical protein GJAV_G00044950 [Gymnothorax javanicus]
MWDSLSPVMQPPYVLRNQPLVVARGGMVIITRSVLWVEDDDNPEDVVISVLDPPQHGQLRRIHGEQLLQTFGLQELRQEELQYVHDDSSHNHDRALLLANDGHGSQSLLLRISVAHKVSLTPNLLSFSTAWVSKGEVVQISQNNLRVDCGVFSQSQIRYTIVASLENPKYGKVVLLEPMPAEKLTEELWKLPDGQIAKAALSFTQQDISEGKVWYQHSGIGPGRDIFQFQISIDGFQEVHSDVYTFTVRVLPQSSIFSLLSSDSSLQITALRDNVTRIWPSALSFTSKEAPNRTLVYKITRPLTQGQGTVEHQDSPHSPVESFSQADINDGQIFYRPSLAPAQQIYQFSFVVTDGEHVTPEMDFVIFLSADGQLPPVFRTPRSVLEVRPGSRAAVSEQQLAISDGDTAPDKLEFKLLEAPSHGTLWKVDGGAEREMLNGDTFTFSDIAQNRLQFDCVGGATEEDLMIFSVTDGTSVATATVQVLVSGVRDNGPQLDFNAQLSLELPEKSSIALGRTHLAYVDNDSPDEMIRIQLLSVPVYGILTRTTPVPHLEKLRALSTFTMDDINCHRIWYTAPSVVSSRPVVDVFHFTVYNRKNNSLENQTFTITTTSAQKLSSEVTLHSGIKVRDGGRVQLSITNVTLRHSNMPTKNWLVWLVIPPEYGFVENTGEGKPQVISLDVPFLMDTLASGCIFYVQNISFSAAHSQDQLSFHISDGSTQTDVLLIKIDIQRTAESLAVISVNKTLLESTTNSSLDTMHPENRMSKSLPAATKIPAYVVLNRGLVLHASSVRKITALQLSVTNQDGEAKNLLYRITNQTQLGHLEHTAAPGIRISTFTQDDLSSGSVQYVHTSEEARPTDSFTFTVADGNNEISQTFHIAMRPVQASLPVVQVVGMSVQRGGRKILSETELKATDADTEERSITFRIAQTPRHGKIEKVISGWEQVDEFTMEDIYRSLISYQHDGSNSLTDHFTFTVTDGTDLLFLLEEGEEEQIVTAAPQKFKIDILPADDSIPQIVINSGLQWLEYINNKAVNLISAKELLTEDMNTEAGLLVYEAVAGPRLGCLEASLEPGTPITTFTQADINRRLIRYVLDVENTQETMDNFTFLVKDDTANVVSDNIFYIEWSFISFEHPSYNVNETAGTVAVPVKRTGSLKHYAKVLCHTEQGTATSSSGPLPQDYVEFTGQVHFDENEDRKMCSVVINDDQDLEDVESFILRLSHPAYTLLGPASQAEVNIFDPEDEPTVQFAETTYSVNESDGILLARIERKGDISATVSVLCYTVSKSAQGSSLSSAESGSDFYTRVESDESRVVFGPGSSVSACSVRLIDDSEYEPPEEFELVLSEPSENARLGDVAVANVVIDGPNDASAVFLGSASFTYKEDAGTIEIPILRQGSDLSSVSSVWCATRPSDPLSATPGMDYIPSSKRVEFKPGVTQQTCSLTIMDDILSPAVEGMESFVVFLSSAQGAILTEPFEASVIITDTSLDIPSMQFEKKTYSVKESAGVLHIPIIRTGDLTVLSSVRCYTQTHSGATVEDYVERKDNDDSRVTFYWGEKVKNCTIKINDDSVFEAEELFQVCLGTPLGNRGIGATVGDNFVTTVIITNDEDAPTIEFEKAKYRVREPKGPDGIEVLSVKVIRRGDQNRTSKVRCSTRDGSARSGVDYNPKSKVLRFSPGMDYIPFKVEVLPNEVREWHESFSLALGPEEPVDAVLGEITTATVIITDQEAAAIRVLPAPPIVVSLSHYDYVEEASKEGSENSPSSGYPLVCVTPCDPRYPKYSMLRERCEGAGINLTSVRFGWEVAAPTDSSGVRYPFEMLTDNTPYTSVNHKVLDSIYFSRRFRVRCVAQAPDKAGHLGPPLRSNTVTIGSEGSICHSAIPTGTTRSLQTPSFTASLKYLNVKHKEHPNRVHISVQIPHQDGMLPLVSTMPLQNLHFLLSESVYRQQHVCSNLVTLKDLQGISEAGFLNGAPSDGLSLGPGYDWPYQFTPGVREAKTIQLYKHLNLKSCLWTFDAFCDMTELIDVCGGSVTADFQARDSAQSFLTVRVPLYVSYIYVTAPRGWASLEHHTEMEMSFLYDTILWKTGIQTDSVFSARLQISKIYVREDGRLVVEFQTYARFRGQFVPDHYTLPGQKSHLVAPDHLGGMEFDLQLLWSAQTFDSATQLWKATSSYSRKDYSGEYTVFLVPCTVQSTQPWTEPGEKPLTCTAHPPEKFLVPIAFQQTNRPVPVVYSLNTEFQLSSNEKAFLTDPVSERMLVAEMDYKGSFSIGQTLYGRVVWNQEHSLNSAYSLRLEKVFLCSGRDGYVPFFDPTGTLYNEGRQYGCLQPNNNLKHRFLLLDRKQPELCDRHFHDVPFEAGFASDSADLQPMTLMPGVDGFTMKVDALYKVEQGNEWYLQVIYVVGPQSAFRLSTQRSLTHAPRWNHTDLAVRTEHLEPDESLIYDNEGDQLKNGTNMKRLKLEMEPEATFDPHTGGSIGGGIAALVVVLAVLLAACFMFKKCRMKKQSPTDLVEEYPLNTKVEVCLEKNFSSMYCSVRKVNMFNMNQDASEVKVKQVNLEVKLHNNFSEGTEV